MDMKIVPNMGVFSGRERVKVPTDVAIQSNEWQQG
jgi:hypothetical protein